MAGCDTDTDSHTSEDSEAHGSSSGGAPVATTHLPASDTVTECAAKSPAEASAAVATGAATGVVERLDGKMQELVAMVDVASGGAEAVQRTHDMMGQLWSICTSQQAQLTDKDQVRLQRLRATPR